MQDKYLFILLGHMVKSYTKAADGLATESFDWVFLEYSSGGSWVRQLQGPSYLLKYPLQVGLPSILRHKASHRTAHPSEAPHNILIDFKHKKIMLAICSTPDIPVSMSRLELRTPNRPGLKALA